MFPAESYPTTVHHYPTRRRLSFHRLATQRDQRSPVSFTRRSQNSRTQERLTYAPKPSHPPPCLSSVCPCERRSSSHKVRRVPTSTPLEHVQGVARDPRRTRLCSGHVEQEVQRGFELLKAMNRVARPTPAGREFWSRRVAGVSGAADCGSAPTLHSVSTPQSRKRNPARPRSRGPTKSVDRSRILHT